MLVLPSDARYGKMKADRKAQLFGITGRLED